MHTLINDLRYAVRQLRKSPGFALTAILTLAIGIGANTAVFSVMNAVLLRSLPVPEPSRVYNLRVTGRPNHTSNTGDDETSIAYPAFEQLRQRHDIFSDLIAAAPLAVGKVSIRYGTEPEVAAGEIVSGNFFSGLGVQMARGRGFTREDETSHAQVAVLGYDFWTRRFARDPEVLGQTLYVKGVPLTIVGVSAAGFTGLERGKGDTDFWIPLQNRVDLNAWGDSGKDGKTFYGLPDWWCLLLTGRLAPGVTPQQAVSRLQPQFQNAAYVGVEHPEAGEEKPLLSLTPARGLDEFAGDYQRPLYLLMSLVALVLLIACTNVALALIARNQSRQREFSLRLAIGAGRMDLFRQLLTESLLLVIAGGALAWAFAAPATRALATWSQLETSLQPDRSVLFFTLGILALAALVFGLAPLRRAMSVPAGLALRSSGAAATQDKHKSRFGQIVVAAQMAMCIVLLVAAGLLLRTLRNLENVPLGMRTQGLLVFGINPQGLHSSEETTQFYQTLLARLRPLPGVESVSLVGNRPGAGWSNNDAAVVDGASPHFTTGTFAPLRGNDVGPDFFHVMGIPVLEGRGITESDTADSQKVVVINKTFAERYLATQNPLGHHVGEKPNERTIVGVVGNNKYTSLSEKDMPMIWTPYTQVGGGGVGQMNVEMHVEGDPMAMLPTVAKAVRELDPNLPLEKPMAQKAQFEESISQQRLFSKLSVFFGLLAGLLVATGLYGTLAYRVNNRTVEIGVRLAVGAQREQVLWMILRESLWVAAVGVGVGLPLALVTSRLLRSMLFGVGPNDPLTFVAALVAVILVALAASLIPARRAASIDPMKALRAE
jgi:predicted permease